MSIIDEFNNIEDMTFVEINNFLHRLPINTLLEISYENGCVFSLCKNDEFIFTNKIIGKKKEFIRKLSIDNCASKIHLDINYNQKHKFIIISMHIDGLKNISRKITTKYFKVSYDD